MTMQPTAFVLDGESRAALAVTRSLGSRRVPVTVVAGRARSLAGCSRYARDEIVLPDVMRAPQEFARQLVDRLEPGAVLLPMTDASLEAVDHVRDRLDDVRLPFPPAATLQTAWDKSALLEVAATADVPYPRTWRPDDAGDLQALATELTFPVVVKPRRSRLMVEGTMREGTVAYARDMEELRSVWSGADAIIRRPLIQERIDGFGTGVFVLADRGRMVATFAHRRLREKPPSGGVSVLRESIAVPPDQLAAAERLVAALGWHGVCMIEFRVERATGTPYLMEINPRFWGSLQLAIDAGVDFPAMLYDLGTDASVSPPPAYRLGVRCRWLLGDLDQLLIRLRRAPGDRDLPPDPPSRLAASLAFLNPFGGRLEIWRAGDLRPALCELRDYVGALVGGRGA